MSELNDEDLVDYEEDEAVDDAKPADDAKKCATSRLPFSKHKHPLQRGGCAGSGDAIGSRATCSPRGHCGGRSGVMM